jgi:hypothetical protein
MRGAIGAKKREADERQIEQQNKPPGPKQPDSRTAGQKRVNLRAGKTSKRVRLVER